MLSRTRASILVVLLVSSSHLLAQSRGQTTGDIRGVVTDASEASIPGAAVIAVNVDTNLSRQVETSVNGDYMIPLLPPGSYDVTCELSGFATTVRKGVIVSIGSVSSVDFQMTVAPVVSETIEVIADAAIVEPGKTQNSTIVDTHRIANLPINQRNYLSFSLTTPGVDTDRAPQVGASGTSGLSFNGQSARYNNIMVDGLDNNDNAVGSVRSTFSQEAIKEFQVVANNFSAEYGRAIGGLVNIVTKSGTNTWGGSLFFFDRDDSFDSDNAFAPAGVDAPFSQMQYGFTFGGPIKKDKTFLFASFERTDVDNNNIVTISNDAAALLRKAGFAVDSGAVPFVQWNNQLFLKVDQILNASHTLSARYTYANSTNENQEPWGGLVAQSRGGSLDLNDQSFSLGLNSILSTSLINEARFQYARRDHDLQSLDPNNGPTVEILGYATVGRQRFLPQPRVENQFQFVDTLSLYKGRHGLKAGFDVNYIRYEASLPLNFGGRYVFAAIPANALYPGSPALTSIQAFALGIPGAFIQAFGDDTDKLNNTLFSFFLQDDWMISGNFTLKLGLRYDLETLPDPIRRDSDNIAPRVALSYTSDDTQTNVRVAAGRFYGVTSTGPIFAVRQSTYGQTRTILLRGAPAVAAWKLPGHKFAADPGVAAYPVRLQADPDFNTGSSDQMSIGIDRALGQDMSLHASFQYVRGRNIFSVRNINPVINPATGQRPIPGFADIYNYESTGDSWHRGMTLSVNRRMSKATEFLLSYTLSKSEDDYIDWITEFQYQDPLNPGADKGPSFQDERHRLVASGLWDLSGYTENAVLDNFMLGTIITYGSGRPYNILAGYDRNGNGDPASDRPVGVGRNAGEGPDFFSVDLRLSKKMYFSGGERDLELLFEVFNLFNRKNYSSVNTVFGPGPSALPTFGQPTAAYPARQIQLGAKLTF
ncbi:MAG: TonB-dependent receptor [Acidobacteria bacterium]|nr:TonB-dependent receptor [Acidobacteriota bacterium]